MIRSNLATIFMIKNKNYMNLKANRDLKQETYINYTNLHNLSILKYKRIFRSVINSEDIHGVIFFNSVYDFSSKKLISFSEGRNSLVRIKFHIKNFFVIMYGSSPHFCFIRST